MIRKFLFLSLAFFLIFIFSSCLKDTPGLSYQEQLEIDLEIIDQYLADNSIIAEADPTGLRYVIHVSGAGAQPNINNCVTFDYIGKFLPSEDDFDDGDDLKIPLGFLIQGFQIGLPLIAEGGSITLYIPSGLAYGIYGNPPVIPKNANVMFDVQLVAVGGYDPDTGSCL